MCLLSSSLLTSFSPHFSSANLLKSSKVTTPCSSASSLQFKERARARHSSAVKLLQLRLRPESCEQSDERSESQTEGCHNMMLEIAKRLAAITLRAEVAAMAMYVDIQCTRLLTLRANSSHVVLSCPRPANTAVSELMG